MSKADLLKLLLAALVAYLTAMGTLQARLAIIETNVAGNKALFESNRANDKELIEKIDRNVDWLREKVTTIDAAVQRLDDRKSQER